MSGLAVAFPGVGSQHSGMGKEYYDQSHRIRTLFEQASDEIHLNLASICFTEEKVNLLNQLEISQIALFTLGVGIYQYIRECFELSPDYLLGHSLGEYVALCCAGSFSFSDGLRLVHHRGELLRQYAESSEGYMAWIINISPENVGLICEKLQASGGKVFESGYNTLTQTAISGDKLTMDKAVHFFEEQGAIVYPLMLEAAYHCPLVAGAAGIYREILNQHTFRMPEIPVLANLTAQPYPNAESVSEYLYLQLINPIHWVQSVLYLKERNIDRILEVGPKAILTYMIKQDNLGLLSISSTEPSDTLQAFLFGPR